MSNNLEQYSVLKFENVYKSFKQGNVTTEVLKNINIQFEQNISYSLVGISGTGKSTIINLLSGLESTTSGKILFNNFNINNFTSSQKDKYLQTNIGLVFQFPYLLRELSVIENILIKGIIAGTPEKEARSKAEYLLEKINLIDKRDLSPEKLSGGEQQRAAIARAIFNKPDFLLADEPTANLDEKNKFSIWNLLASIHQESGMGLIITTHDHTISQFTDIKLELSSGNICHTVNPNSNKIKQKMSIGNF